jgi:hypothetical protein
MILSFKSTQFKLGRKWLTNMRYLKNKNREVPMFGAIYKVTSETQKNDKHTWKGYVIKYLEFITNPEIFKEALHFRSIIEAGQVEIDTIDDFNDPAPASNTFSETTDIKDANMEMPPDDVPY